MLAFGRMIAAFGLMMVLGYLAVVVLLPAPDASAGRIDGTSASSTASRLSQEARALATRKPASSLQ